MWVDSHQQMCFLPVDRIAVDEALAGLRCVEPEAEESVLPHSAGGILGAGDEPRVRCTNGLPGERLGDPYLSLAAVVQPDVGILAVELVGAELRADARAVG